MAFDCKGTLNKVMLIGRLGADPELKYTPAGAAVLTLSLATNTSWKDQEGKAQEKTEWHRVVAWRKLAEVIGQYAKKGSRLYVEGKVVTRSWTDKDGTKRYTTEIQAESIQLLEGRGEREGAEMIETPLPTEADFNGQSQGSNSEDDLPF
ncbi:MAG TPA: single-stranded DNA-binding protein [bacterium]|nr:single-stranded DNA-binding protein [bacterium]HQG44562.1 single-stranded DNA-binding protein [bacterium]HQI47338.1 single-stranded DNA-binding protein [bacterium]HQJ63387.1 single-stranded DNA-binding protein [bacterium]